MFPHGGHVGTNFGKTNIWFKGHRWRTIPSHFGYSCIASFRKKGTFSDFSIGFEVKLCSAMAAILDEISKNWTRYKGHFPRNNISKFGSNWPSSFWGEGFSKFIPHFSIFSNISHFDWDFGKPNKLCEGHHQRTIPEKFGSHWPSGFREEWEFAAVTKTAQSGKGWLLRCVSLWSSSRIAWPLQCNSDTDNTGLTSIVIICLIPLLIMTYTG